MPQDQTVTDTVVSTIPVFKLLRKEESIQLQDPRTHLVSDYTVREMTGADRDAYFQAMSARQKVLPDGRTVVATFGGIQSELISRCLFVKGPGGTSANVQAEVINTWPSSVVEAIHKICERINGMDKPAEEAVKNA